MIIVGCSNASEGIKSKNKSPNYGTIRSDERLDEARRLTENKQFSEARALYEQLLAPDARLSPAKKAVAQAQLGQLYFNGLGGERQSAKARQLFEEALDQKDSLSAVSRAVIQLYLGYLLEKGIGGVNDMQRADNLYNEALSSQSLPAELKKFALSRAAQVKIAL